MAETSQKVIQYVADLTQLRKDLAKIEILNKQLVSVYGQDATRAVKTLGTTISSLKTKTIIDDKGLQRTIPVVESVSQSFKTADGRLQQFTITNKTMKDGTVQTSQSLKDMNKNTVPLVQNLAKLAKRAALTIPVWLALRGAVMGTIKAFKDSVKAIQEQDKAFQKARRNLEATASSQTELTANFSKLRRETLALSLASGKSVEELTHAFQRFATVGFDAETSLAGMQYATKLAVAEFGDARETADAFARSMRVLIDRSEGAKSEAQQLAEAMALTDQLWQTNAFEIQEFTHNLQNFAGTAKAANLSTQETITLLATLSTGGLANRAGRLLRTTILKSLQNLDEVAQSLNLHIDPAVDSTFDVILKLVGGLRELSSTQNVPQELADVLGDLFNIRTTEVLAALRALEDTLRANAAVVPDVKKLDDTFENVSNTTGILIDRIHNLNRQIGVAFVNGAVGGENFNESLKIIAQYLLKIEKRADKAGLAFRTMVLHPASGKHIVEFYKQSFDKAFTEAEDRVESGIDKIIKTVNKGLKGKLDTTEIQNLLIELETFGAENLQLDTAAFDALTNALKTQLQIQKEITVEQKKQEVSVAKQSQANKVLLEDALERLKAAGALQSTILDVEKSLKAQLNISDKYEDALTRQLEKERAITEEQRLRGRLSSDAVKLFKIAQTEGTAVAKKIGEVLAGNIDFASFVRRGGKELEVFKKEFEDIFTQKQAEAFFKGDVVPGEKGMRGGFEITLPTEDEAIRKSASEIVTASKVEVSLAQRRLAIEGQINAARLQSLNRAEQLIQANRAAGQGYFQTVINKTSPADQGYVTSVPTTAPAQPSSIQFSSGGVNISINAKNAEDLDKQIDQHFESMKNATKKEVKDAMLGKQNPTY